MTSPELAADVSPGLQGVPQLVAILVDGVDHGHVLAHLVALHHVVPMRLGRRDELGPRLARSTWRGRSRYLGKRIGEEEEEE